MSQVSDCPFCGEEPYLRQWANGARIECQNKGCFGPVTSIYGDSDQAIAAWNRRDAGGEAEGWKLVPVEPTAEMLSAVQSLYDDSIRSGKGMLFKDAYHTMLAAAPPHGSAKP